MENSFYVPGYPLAEFINTFWLYNGPELDHGLERVLPTGAAELIFNLHDDVIRSYYPHDHGRFQMLPGAIVAGPRSEFMVIDAASQISVMGINFKPGGAFPFLGIPCCDLHGLDVPLDALWGAEAARVRERLLEAPVPEAKFRVMEQALLARLVRPLKQHPAVMFAVRELQRVPQTRTLARLVQDVGLSQRRFIELFREQVGMPPKLYYRIRRFQEALRKITAGGRVEWADLALSCGYYDQAHFIRDFRSFSGISPSAYALQRGEHFNHVLLC